MSASQESPPPVGPAAAQDSEGRRHDRSKVIRAGQIAFVGGGTRCVVLDISDVGGRIRLTESVEVPDLLILRLDGAPDRAAHRRWQQGREIGVEFLPT